MIKLGVSFISFCLRAVLENIKFKKLIYKTARPFIMETMLWPSLSIIIRNVLQTVPGFWTQVSAMFSTKIIIIMRYIACICWSVDKIGYQSCLAQCMTNMSGIAKCDLVKKKKIHFKHFNSCRFHHRVYYKLTMACSPVALISSMDRALCPVITNARVRFLVQDWIFSCSFSRLFFLLQRSCSLSCYYVYPQFKIWFLWSFQYFSKLDVRCEIGFLRRCLSG